MSESTLGRRIWALFMREGYTKGAFAAVLGVSYGAVDNWTLGHTLPSIPTLMRIALIFEESLEDLCFGSEGRERYRAGLELPSVLTGADVAAWLAERKATPRQVAAVMRACAQRPATMPWLETYWSERTPKSKSKGEGRASLQEIRELARADGRAPYSPETITAAVEQSQVRRSKSRRRA
jgi:transcriptional regulator with XRE-family HTH domain